MKQERKTASLALIILAVCLIVWAPLPNSRADDLAPLPDGHKVNLEERCPVCGMIVGGDLGATVAYSYRDDRPVGFAGVAAAVFKDGRVVGFEGARCMFIYGAVPKRFGIEVENITSRFVTDFSARNMIDVTKAFLVLGSPVKGPMGYELIPFSTLEEAEKFKAQFGGKRIVQLGTGAFTDVERESPPLKEAPVPEPSK